MQEQHSFGALLRHYRAAAGLTQEELAERAGLSARAITDLERGVRRFPYPETVARLGHALQLGDAERAELRAVSRRVAIAPPIEHGRDRASNNLPTPLTSFIGRELEVASVRELLATARLVTVVGVGGVGKTRLALQVAVEVLDAFDDGVFFVDLVPIGDQTLVLSSIAGVLNVRQTGGHLLLDALKAVLRRKALLLVLDNFEHVLGAAPDVSALLQACPQLHVLVTSRAVLHISGEHQVSLAPLQLPQAHATDVAESVGHSEAGRMFVERAQAARPEFQLTRDNAAAVARICRRLDGLPLAIELAAARVRLLPPQALLTRLERRLPLLTGGGRDLPLRHQTLRSTIAWSYDLLSEDEQTLFRRLAVFSGSFTLESAETICNADGHLHGRVMDGIDALLANSLLRTAGLDSEPRIGMLETVREYARDQLVAHGEETAMLRAHAAYFSALLGEAERQYGSTDPRSWGDYLVVEHDNLRAALSWILEVRDAHAALEFGARVWRLWVTRGLYTEGRSWVARIMALAGAAEPSVERARILVAGGILADMQSDFGAAQALYAEGLTCARAVNDGVSIMRVFNNLAVVAALRGDFSKAGELAKEGLKAAVAAGELGPQALLLNTMCRAAFAQADFPRARALGEASLALAEEIDSPQHVARALQSLGLVAYARGDHERAQSLLERSLPHARDSADQSLIARSRAELGRVATARGEYDRGHTLLTEALNVLQTIGDRYAIALCLERLGELAAHEGRAERALLLVAAAARLRDVLGTPVWTVEHDLLEHGLEPARATLGDRAAGVWSSGRSMPLEQALELAAAREEPPLVAHSGDLAASYDLSRTTQPT
jgi:predicted ATPase/DNA-binding XRE family transcriptional regulator